MAKTKKVKKTKKEKVKKVSTPHVEVIGDGFDSKKGIKLELDWNDEFIEYLKKIGYIGVSDETIVQKWLSDVNAQIIKEINPDKKSDFD